MGNYAVRGMVTTMLLALAVASAASPARAGGSPLDLAAEILKATGVNGGLVVHVGCGDGRLTAALGAGEGYLVHGLDADEASVEEARRHVRAAGLYGKVSIDRLRGRRLPYTDNLVNLLVVEKADGLDNEEMMRVLAPGGTAYVGQGAHWSGTVKPRPKEVDDWTHFLYDASNNAVSKDTTVGPPHHLQWVCGPRYARSHEQLASMSGLVSAGNRIFYVVDEGSRASVALPAKWFLAARDAFNGVLLWKLPITKWEGYLRDFRCGPPELPRRLVAVGERLYVALNYGDPVTAMNAASGREVRTYEATEGALEILLDAGRLYVLAADPEEERAAGSCMRTSGQISSFKDMRLVALEAESGNVLWEKKDADTREIMPLTLAVGGDRVFYQGINHLVCLDAKTGRENWKVSRPVIRERRAWSTPTLVVHDGVVLSVLLKDQDGQIAAVEGEPRRQIPADRTSEHITWIAQNKHWYVRATELTAFSAETGKELWRTDQSGPGQKGPLKEGFNSPTDVFVIGGGVSLGSGQGADVLDPQTGKVISTRARDGFAVGMGHHRCYRDKATERFILMGHAGVEFIDVKTGEGFTNNWVRGTCQYGIMPANGLLYAPPHTCACYIQAKLDGFNALAPKRESPPAAAAEAPRLEKGPAYDASPTANPAAAIGGDWPTYRRDAGRSGSTEQPVPASVKQKWSARLDGRLSSVVVADGRVFVAEVDRHAVVALDAANGREAWRFTAGGRVDSPPTVAAGLAVFGCADGHVYCLRASDGQLVWRFRAAPEDRRIVSYDQLESAWPVNGSVLVLGDTVYAAAGRSSYVDGGIHLCALDLRTGQQRAATCLDSRDPKTGKQPNAAVDGQNMAGAMPDILVGTGESVCMRHTNFSLDLKPGKETPPHMYSATGFLDDSWWHRTMWLPWGNMLGGCFGWATTGKWLPSGRILAMDKATVYGFGRKNYDAYNGSHPILREGYQLFAVDHKIDPVALDMGTGKRLGLPREEINKHGVTYKWQEPVPILVRAMVLAGDTLFIAGPPETVDPAKWRSWTLKWDGRNAAVTRYSLDEAQSAELARQSAALEGLQGSLLLAVSTADGKTISELKLDSAPVFDGMAAASGRLYLAAMDGHVMCLEEVE